MLKITSLTKEGRLFFLICAIAVVFFIFVQMKKTTYQEGFIAGFEQGSHKGTSRGIKQQGTTCGQQKEAMVVLFEKEKQLLVEEYLRIISIKEKAVRIKDIEIVNLNFGHQSTIQRYKKAPNTTVQFRCKDILPEMQKLLNICMNTN